MQGWKVCWENLRVREGDYLRDMTIDGDNTKIDLQEMGWANGEELSGSG